MAVVVGVLAAGWCAAGASAAGGSVVFGGGEGERAGQLHEAKAVAVDNSGVGGSAGDVYVADRNNNRVDKFGANGEFLLAWGWGVADGAARLESCGPGAVPASSECLAGLEGSGAGEFVLPAGVAVNSDPVSGSVGGVYVVDNPNHRVEEFTPDGEFVLMFGGEVDGRTKGDVCPAVESTECQAGVEGTGEGEFGGLAPKTVAVDGEGTVYVGDVSRVQEFSETGVFKLQVTVALAEEFVTAVTVDSAGRLYVMLEGQAGVHVFKACVVSCVGEEVAGSPVDPAASGFDSSVVLGPSGVVFVAEGERVSEFDASGVEVASFPAGLSEVEAAAFGVGVGRLYVLYATFGEIVSLPVPGPLVEREEALAEPAAVATVRASIDAEGAATKYRLIYNLEGSAPVETAVESLAGEGFEPEPVEVGLSGLRPGGGYEYHFVAENEHGVSVGETQRFSVLPAVSIESVSVSGVSAGSARLAAQINPLGTATEYRFEYGRTTAYEEPPVPVPDGNVGAGLAGVPVSALVENLTPATVYHYRVIAHNALGEVISADHTFTTLSTTRTAGLIDGRAWELVSPVSKHGAPLGMPNNEAGVIQAADSGGAFTYFAFAPAGSEPAGNRSLAYTQLFSTRTSPGVWSTLDIATRQNSIHIITPGGNQTEYKQFSSDLSGGLVEPVGATPLSPLASERTPYVREAQAGEYLPLLPAAGLRAGVKFGGKEVEEPIGGQIGGGAFIGGVEFLAGTSDLSHVVVQSPSALTSGFEEGFEGGEKSLYEWGAGALRLVSILPSGQPTAEAGDAAALGANDHDMRNAISADGARVAFETYEPPQFVEHHLFVRDVGLGQSVQLDVVQGRVVKAGAAAATFVDATADGSRVFFLDSQRLTRGAGGGDLYMCDVGVVGGRLSCALKDLTVPLGGGESAGVAGADLGVDETGTFVYFVAFGVLAPGGVAGQPNLYVQDTVSGETRLVATLSGDDSPDWEPESKEGARFKGFTARVSENGRFVAFMSDRSLTGFDNVDARSGARDEEVFLYDRVGNTLRCVSCDPSGGRPTAVFDPGNEDQVNLGEIPLLVDEPGVWKGEWLAGSLPAWPLVDNDHSLYGPRNLDDSGRLFFDAVVGLVPQDVNGREDVYEFEPAGVGGCGLEGGCVGLISSGTSAGESAFMDASGVGPGGGEGEDAFFMSEAKLVAQDVDSALDVYDAHVCSVGAPCASGVTVVAPACNTAESCRQAPMAQPAVFGAPASSTFSGPGNPPVTGKSAAQLRAEKLARALKACRKDKSRRRRTACEKRARHAYGKASKRGKASKGGRTRKAGKSGVVGKRAGVVGGVG